MIKVDFAEIEQITDILVKMASDSDEVFNRLRHISMEMQEDLELAAYPQSGVALEAVSVAIDALNRGNDTLQSLRSAMLPVATTYQENEQKVKDALSRMTVQMDKVCVGYSAAIASDSITHVEHSDAVVSQSKLQQLVAESVEEMQVTNIAAVTKVVREEYEISGVEDLVERG